MLKSGCASRSILPGHPMMLCGYAGRNQLAETVEEPLELGVVALNDGNTTILIVTVDTLGIPLKYCRQLAAAVEERFQIPEAQIWFCGSHTHFAPGFELTRVIVKGGKLDCGEYPADPTYFVLCRDKLLEAVGEALARLEPVTLEHLAVDVPGLHFNRRARRKSDGMVDMCWRYPEHPEKYDFQPVDSTLHAWRFLNAEKISAVLGRYSCHPVTGGVDNYAYSGEFPYYFRQAVKRLLDCPGFFMLGAAGDVVPRFRHDGVKARPHQAHPREDIGEILALHLRMNELYFRPENEVTLKNKVVEVPVELLVEPDVPAARKVYDAAVEANHGDLLAPAVAEPLAALDMAQRYEKRNFTLPLRLLKLGSMTLVGMPFEVVSAISLRLREAFPNAVLVSITGGYEGYLPLQEDFPRGGYEPGFGATRFAAGTGDRFLEAAKQALRDF